MTTKAIATLKEVVMSREMFDRLPEYSCSTPTGTTIGKCWKRNTTAFTSGYTKDGPWVLGCYERRIPPKEPGSPGRRGRSQVLIRWRDIIVLDQ